MSGNEVVGVVLGALPLIISALEHQRSVLSRLHMLANFLKKILLPLARDEVLAEDELEELMLDAGGARWKASDVDEALKARLGESRDRYVELNSEVQCLAWQLLEPLAQSSAFQKHFEAETIKERLMQRAYTQLVKTFRNENDQIKFARLKTRRVELLDSIHRKIKTLTRLLDASDQVAILDQSVRTIWSTRAVQGLLQYWRHADRVYTLMEKTWTCTCKSTHCVHLWLQHSNCSVKQFKFRMLVLFAPRGRGVPLTPPWQQHGLQIKWIAAESIRRPEVMVPAPSQQPVEVRSSMVVKTKSPSLLNRKRDKNEARKPSVRFDVAVDARATIPFIRSPVMPPMAVAASGFGPKRVKTCMAGQQSGMVSDTEEIQSLCHAIEICGMQQATCLGSLIDKSAGSSCRYLVSSQPEQKMVAEEISLYDILQTSHKPRLNRAQRFQIALKVASSHLQLHSTPWARKQWESVDVKFPRTGANTLLNRPFVSANFESASSLGEQEARRSDRSFACLGIILLELLWGLQLEEHYMWQQLGGDEIKSKPLFQLMVALQWANEVTDEAGPDYASAVRWCLAESPTTLQGDQWRKDLADRVVLPLENCCKWITTSL